MHAYTLTYIHSNIHHQGWFQYTYLQHLQRLYDIQWPLDCGSISSRGSRMPEASLRSQCFASLLYLSGLMPLPNRPHILYQPHRVTDILTGSNSSSSGGSSSSSSSSGGHKGVRFCVMAGLTTEDRFNTHDWASECHYLPLLVHTHIHTCMHTNIQTNIQSTHTTIFLAQKFLLLYNKCMRLRQCIYLSVCMLYMYVCIYALMLNYVF